MQEKKMLCSEIECAPPLGGKKDCEFCENGYCAGAIRPGEDVENHIRNVLHEYGIRISSQSGI